MSDFDDITGVVENEFHGQFGAGVEEKVYQAAHHSHDSREDQMKRFLVDSNELAQEKEALQMAAKIGQNSPNESFQRSQPLHHGNNI
jgi:hypothetical protein